SFQFSCPCQILCRPQRGRMFIARSSKWLSSSVGATSGVSLHLAPTELESRGDVITINIARLRRSIKRAPTKSGRASSFQFFSTQFYIQRLKMITFSFQSNDFCHLLKTEN